MKKVYKNIHQDLIEACGKGNQKAQFEIYKLYYRSMYNVSLRIVNNTGEAEDIMQDSFLDAFGQLDKYKGTATFGAWLKRIVINNSLDVLRKNANLTFVEEYDYDMQEELEEETEYVDLKIDEIRKAMSALPDDYRVVLTLYLLEGYDHEEIGEILNISNSTSRIRYFRGKKKLRDILDESRIKNLLFK
ncbi:MAG: sigma-70 family RNA polymerase sigma factor [Bacteroidales bacterium]|nr:sigma-70 family RNA polymerase sigma factor [Bacteroidales bacterium]